MHYFWNKIYRYHLSALKGTVFQTPLMKCSLGYPTPCVIKHGGVGTGESSHCMWTPSSLLAPPGVGAGSSVRPALPCFPPCPGPMLTVPQARAPLDRMVGGTWACWSWHQHDSWSQHQPYTHDNVTLYPQVQSASLVMTGLLHLKAKVL